MADGKTHGAIGVLVGVGAALAVAHDQPPRYALAEIVGAVVGAWLGSAMPDMVEPATSPNHRGTAHSLAALGVDAAAIRAYIPLGVEYLREAAGSWRQRASGESLDRGARNWATVMEYGCHVLVGFGIGFLAGYASHLVLDAGTPAGLPTF